MRTLLVLCAGNERINHIPVCVNRHPDGRMLAEKAIEGIYSKTYQRIIYVVTESIDKEFNVKKSLLKEIHRNIEVVCISEETNGPADTVYWAIKQAQIQGEFVVRDCSNSIEIENNIYGNFVSGLDLTTYSQDVYKVGTKSFIVVNEQNQVLDIIEKRFRSDVISLGLYGFKSADDFLMAYEKLNDPAYPISKLYLSNIISYLIGYDESIFHCVPVTHYEDWGSFETWNQIQRKYATCIVDADSMIGEILSNKNMELLLNTMSEIGTGHMRCVIITSGEVDSDMLKKCLVDNGINCMGVVSGISQSNKKIIVSTPNDLKLASMEV